MLTFAITVFLLIVTPGPGVLSTAGFGAAYGYNEAAEKTDYFKDGGLATMFTRRR